jgi:hypothetical protein
VLTSDADRIARNGEFEVVGRQEGGLEIEDRVFFARGAATVVSREEDKLGEIRKDIDLELHGFVSEDEAPELAQARAEAVAAALAEQGHTGKREVRARPEAGAGRIDYRFMRSVELVPVGFASETPGPAALKVDCSSQLAPARDKAAELLTGARTKLEASPRAPETTGLLARLFGGPQRLPVGEETATTLKENLGKVDVQLGTLLGDTAKHECHSDLDGGCSGAGAYTNGVGADAMMTICPRFDAQPTVELRAGILMHEASHATPGLATLDYAYTHERRIEHLTTAEALRNADSYRLFPVLLVQSEALPVGPAARETLVTGFEEGQAQAVRAAFAWLERLLSQAETQVGLLYEAVKEVRRDGRWREGTDPEPGFYEQVMLALADAGFPVARPPAVPGLDDQQRLAALHARQDAWKQLLRTQLNVRPSDTMQWVGMFVGIGPQFYTVNRAQQVRLLLDKLISTDPAVPEPGRARYATLALRVNELLEMPAPS